MLPSLGTSFPTGNAQFAGVDDPDLTWDLPQCFGLKIVELTSGVCSGYAKSPGSGCEQACGGLDFVACSYPGETRSQEDSRTRAGQAPFTVEEYLPAARHGWLFIGKGFDIRQDAMHVSYMTSSRVTPRSYGPLRLARPNLGY